MVRESKTTDVVAAGQWSEDECVLRVDSCNTLFHAGDLAIKECTRTLSGRVIIGRMISIAGEWGIQVQQKTNLLVVARRNKLNLVWINGNVGWKGNERTSR